MPTPSIQTLRADAQQVLNLDSISAVRSVVAATLANANAGTPLNPNLTTQQLWNEFYQIVTQPKSDIESIIANQLMKFLYAPPAPGGAGADKQVIFNDGGVLAGDPQFLWNKTTNLLTVTGSATITGALTVDTTTLVVNPAGYPDRVGIGTASPSKPLEVYNTTESTVWANTTTGIALLRAGGTGGDFYFGIDNSTGGGFGQGNYSRLIYSTGAYPIVFSTNATERLRIDSSGNVGIGVVPSAWSSSFKALQIGNQALWSVAGGNGYLSNNTTFNTSNAYVYRDNGFATEYIQSTVNGIHAWFNAPSGIAGNAITFTQSMTLDASGNLSLANGNLVMGTSGKGIDFSAVTGGTGTATGNVLNDYEEGTFTPTVIGTTTAGTIGTYYAQTGRYTKVGRLVTVQVYLAWGSGTGTGDLAFAGLPFTNGSIPNNYASSTIGYFHDFALTASNVPSMYISPNSSRCDLYQFPIGGGSTTPVPYDVNAAIMFTATYFTA